MKFQRASLELKVEVLTRLAAGETPAEVAKALNISRNSVYRWKHDEAAQAAAGIEFIKSPPNWVEPKEAKPKKATPPRTKGKKGRPSPIEDVKLRERFLDACALSVSPEHLADLVGVSPATIKNWIRSGEKGEGVAAEWSKEIRRAVAEGVIHLHKKISSGSPTWKAAAWMLAHRFPDLYSERREIVSSTQDPTDDLSDAELLDIIGEEEDG